MKFASITFRIAGIWGLIVILPMYFLYEQTGRQDPPPLNHPLFYFGFLGVTLAWQVLFLILATDPVRYRPMMIAAMLEKVGYALAALVLLSLKMIAAKAAAIAVPDVLQLVLFIAAYRKTPAVKPSQIPA